jgi:DNA-binding beta-propeller fold protein YncE
MRAFLGAAAVALCVTVTAQAAEPPYAVVDRIAAPDGDYDYLAYDPSLQRLFVGREAGVMVVDFPQRAVTPVLVPAANVAAVLLLPHDQLALSTNYDGNDATLFDRQSGAVRATLPTGTNPDNALYDAKTSLVLVMNGKSKDATLLDPRSAKVAGRIALGDKPEGTATDGQGRVFVNLEDSARIAVLDPGARKVVRKFNLPGCIEPTGLAFDAVTNLLIAACHNQTAKLIDAKTGKDRGTLRVGRRADGVVFDSKRRRVAIPCADGTLSVFALDATGRAGPVTSVPTGPGARTATLDPASGRLFLPTVESRAAPDGASAAVPGTFAILVLEPRGTW